MLVKDIRELNENAIDKAIETYWSSITPYDNGENETATKEDFILSINEWLASGEWYLTESGAWIETDNLITELKNIFDYWYANINKIPDPDYCLGYGDGLIASKNEFVSLLAKRRKDIFSSDNEVIALGYTISNIRYAYECIKLEG